MKSRQKQMYESNDPQLNLFSLQKNLLQVWESLNVDEYYQNLILSHLDSLPGHEAQSVITKEIKATHEGSSQYFKLAERLRVRKKELTTLSNLVGGQGGQDELPQITQLLGELRDHNLVVAEMLIGLHREYSGEGAGVSDECMQMLQSLDADNDFLKQSFLSQFILFQQGYDPFLLYHYDMRAKKSAPQAHPLIDQLFNLSISYACRLFKAKTKILQILTEGKFNETKTFKRRSKSYGKKKANETIGQPDIKRGTSSNFNVRRRFSLDKAKERERMHTIDASLRQTPSKQSSPIVSKGKMEELFQGMPSDESGEEQEAFKLVPVRYRVKKGFPRSQFLQDVRKQSIQTQPNEEQNMKYSLSFKEKLQPIARKPQKEQTSNRNSIFKRSTIKQPLILPIPTQKEAEQSQSPLASRNSKTSPQEAIKSSNGSQGKQIKMRPGKVTINQLIKYLKELDLTQEMRAETVMNSRFEQSLAKCQSYLSEFTVGGQIKAVGVSFALPDGDYLVKLWAPLRSCGEDTSKMLLRKYLEYLQRQTSCNCLYYGGNSKSLFLSLNFQAKNDKLFFRRRIAPLSDRQLEFPQFLSLKCSSILFPQENRAANILYSDQIEAFSPTNHYLMPAFAAASREGLTAGVQLAAKVSHDIADMKALNSLLEDQQFDTYDVASTMKITQIAAIRIAAAINFRSPFLAGEGNFKLSGQELLRRGQSLMIRVQGVQLGAQIFFGKGMASMAAFIQAAKQSQDPQKRKPCEFAVRMFNKQLYGRIPNGNGQLCSYGNWEFSLSWKDELQGRVRHNISAFQSFGPEPFFFGLELEKQLVFCFEVTSEDFLY